MFTSAQPHDTSLECLDLAEDVASTIVALSSFGLHGRLRIWSLSRSIGGESNSTAIVLRILFLVITSRTSVHTLSFLNKSMLICIGFYFAFIGKMNISIEMIHLYHWWAAHLWFKRSNTVRIKRRMSRKQKAIQTNLIHRLVSDCFKCLTRRNSSTLWLI